MTKGSSCYIGCLLLLAFGTTEARAQNDADCMVELKTRAPDLLDDDSQAFCTLLAGFIFTSLTAAEAEALLAPDSVTPADIFSQRDLQNRSSQQAALAGTPAQGQAIPGVQPAAVAAGTIAAVGTEAGQEALAALSINPAVLFLAETASAQLARLSRFADVTVLVPVSGATRDEESSQNAGTLRYLGVRVRLNFTGLSAGSAVWEAADQILRARISQSAQLAAHVESIVTGTSDVAGCTAALLAKGAPDVVNAACGVPFVFTPDLALATELRRELARVRRAADASYFGVDFRIDFGDPTLGAVDNARGQFLFAGLAAGRRFAGSGAARSGVRARLGVRHGKLDSEEAAEFAAEGGVGIELSRSVDDGALSISGAIEFRYGNASANLTDQFQTNFAMLRGSVLLPVTTGNSISINLGAPLAGDVSPIFSVNFNWGLILGDQIAPLAF